MKNLLEVGFILILSTCISCRGDSEPLESSIGTMKITVTYPEAVFENNEKLGYRKVAGEGAVVRLFYNKNAKALGYKMAHVGYAKDGEQTVNPKYAFTIGETGELLFEGIKAGDYYITVFAYELETYSEKYITIEPGDTLVLSKCFSYNAAFFLDMEPWIYDLPFLE